RKGKILIGMNFKSCKTSLIQLLAQCEIRFAPTGQKSYSAVLRVSVVRNYLSITFGTLKKSLSLTGAFCNASSCAKQGDGTSSRHACAFSTAGVAPDVPAKTWAMGGTSDVSSSLRRSM